MVRYLRYITAVLQLIRWPNLVIVAVTQILIRQCIIVPLLARASMEPQLSPVLFTFLVLATVFIAAGGYAINDYFDRKIDRINKPNDMIVGTKIIPRHAMAYHLVFTISGVILGIWVAASIGQLYLGLVFFMVSGLLWFYSTTYKRELLIGNVIVALLTALVPFIVLLFELPLLASEYGSKANSISRYLMIWVLGFSLFAFLINLIREIVKDSEDLEGDQAYGKRTIPVVWGEKPAKLLSLGLIVVTIVLLVVAWLFFIRDQVTSVYFVLMIIVPLCLVFYLLLKSNELKILHKASIWLKITMLSGLGYMIVANLIMNYLT